MYLGTMRGSFGHYFGHYFGQYLGTIWALCPAEKAEDWEALQRTPNVPELCKNRSRNFLLQMLKPAEKVRGISAVGGIRECSARQGLWEDC